MLGTVHYHVNMSIAVMDIKLRAKCWALYIIM